MPIRIIQIGVGNIGSELIRQIMRTNPSIKFLAVSDSSGAIINENSLTNEELLEILKTKKENKKIKDLQGSKSNELLDKLIKKSKEKLIVVDVTASDNVDLLLKAKENGNYVVLANKKPLCGDQKTYKKLVGSKTYYEATAGAGLPTIKTIKYLLGAGDKIKEIEGCFSGTLGFICSELETGTLFSQSVKKAKELGYTEPDPRDDLAGMDVARKALILARLIGLKLELGDIIVEPMLGNSSDQFLKLNAGEFMEKIALLDDCYKQKVARARNNKNVLRYVAGIKEGKCTVGLKEVPMASEIGSLNGTDNIFVIYSDYYEEPMVIMGRGAGAICTAGGVFGDINAILEIEGEGDGKN